MLCLSHRQGATKALCMAQVTKTCCFVVCVLWEKSTLEVPVGPERGALEIHEAMAEEAFGGGLLVAVSFLSSPPGCHPASHPVTEISQGGTVLLALGCHCRFLFNSINLFFVFCKRQWILAMRWIPFWNVESN